MTESLSAINLQVKTYILNEQPVTPIKLITPIKARISPLIYYTMYIKEVNISGFRSYRETTVNDFSPRHNVVVGRNGSGKSNFFFAIQFVLSDEFSHLKAEQRQGLIHEGTGDRVTTASVEIVFDNADHRIVAIEANEVRVLRRVSMKKDQYFIDAKLVARSDVVNLMESAGFSRSNPYYIVKQGKINELATSPDSHRLKLLREVAGTRVYDERKEESLKILRETNAKSEKIETLLSFIEERLKTLEEEKEDLKEYQKWDKMKRSIEYMIYDNELKEARKKLDKLAEQREEMNTRQSKVTNDLLNAQNRALQASAEQRKLEARFKGMREEKEALLAEQTERVQRKTELELLINDLREDDKAEDVLNKLKTDIAAKEEELNTIIPKYKALVEDAARLNTDIRIAEQRSKELYAKQGYRDQYKTVEERDKDEEQEEQQLHQKIMEIGLGAEEFIDKLTKMNQDMADLRRRLDEASVAQQEASREEKASRDNLEAIKVDVQQSEQDFRRLVPKSVMNGVDSVRHVLDHFRAQNRNGQYDSILNGYRIVIELFHCDKAYYQAVEVTTGNRLFYHVVDDDRIAMKIMKEINQQKLLGEINFFPLNRLIAKPRREVNDPEARLLIDGMEYEPIYGVVFRHIFGNVAVVRSMFAGNRLAKREGFDCVTFEGDQMSRRGEMTGGFLDMKRSRLELYNAVQQMHARKVEFEEAHENAVHASNEKASNVEKLRMEVDTLEREVLYLKDKHKTASEKKRYLSQQLQQSTKNKEPKLADRAVLVSNKSNSRNGSNERKFAAAAWHSSAFATQRRRKNMLDQLQDDIKEKKIRLDSVSRLRAELESTKLRLENQLTTNLHRKRESLQSKIHDISVDEKRNHLQSEMAELKSVNNRLSEIITRLSELEEHLGEFEMSDEKLTRELEDCQEQQKIWKHKLQIRELGSLPMDSKNYESYSLKQLDKKLSEALEQLKKYENVNKKALDQFVQASGQKEDLAKRMDEHRANQKAISDLLTVLDQRKYEAIQLTFKQVSKNFHIVFEKLVPGGYGSLVMRVSHDEDSQPSQDQSDLHQIETLQVSFTGTSETREMQQLSGGQKSLVALALIFAIQKCDPAPFYLFDEIDAALDAQHRKAVADMIHELSQNAQFITTTFRPELLDSAEKYYGVRFRNKVSHIDIVSKEQAFDFVEDDQTHAWILLNVGLSFSNLILHHYRYVKHLSVKEFEFLLGNSRTFEIHRLKPSINRPLPNIFSDEIKPKALCSDEGKVLEQEQLIEQVKLTVFIRILQFHDEFRSAEILLGDIDLIREQNAIELPSKKKVKELKLQLRMKNLRLHSSGVFSNVYRGTLLNPEPRKEIVLKKLGRIILDLAEDSHINIELDILLNLSRGGHKNIIQICDTMVFDYLPQTVSEIVKQIGGENPDYVEIKLYSWQLFNGLAYLSNNYICHRDIKPQNLLIEPISDVWSGGCVLGEITKGNILFPGKNTKHQLKLIIEVLGSPSETELMNMKTTMQFTTDSRIAPRGFRPFLPHASEEIIDILQRILVYSPKKRLCGKVLLSDPFFQELFVPNKRRTNGTFVSNAITLDDLQKIPYVFSIFHLTILGVPL
ncbi:Structural maintenance of chromosomes protein [Dirofilaria immitis]|nr:Structural maintenance of chromosomes protein [Dirofilaria immitis]